MLSPAEGIPFIVWDDGLTVAYSNASGDTHLLSPLAGAILSLLAVKAHSSWSLLQELPGGFFEQHSVDALDSIEAVLSELASINLILCAQN